MGLTRFNLPNHPQTHMESPRSVERRGPATLIVAKRTDQFRTCKSKVMKDTFPTDFYLNPMCHGGLISQFDSSSGKHTIIYEDGRSEDLDMSKEDWEFL
ncbi:Histone-lysine N-methyltransferase ASHH3 [Acorus calamus]|uniref:Histone-lysine N-methyltransferase ASHH3 n=1 Tax=Acorus calamus TaxID=4465 RepID=A0AAV9CQQ6_ACOCL|nr:Histone-lysine N-methyltransferase ASHH3 [Acorus calamus]